MQVDLGLLGLLGLLDSERMNSRRSLRLYDEAKYLYPYHFYDRSPSYFSVDPNSKAGSVADAGGGSQRWG